jgi:hypothetical protein
MSYWIELRCDAPTKSRECNVRGRASLFSALAPNAMDRIASVIRSISSQAAENGWRRIGKKSYCPECHADLLAWMRNGA